jgi:hypothetical protein
LRTIKILAGGSSNRWERIRKKRSKGAEMFSLRSKRIKRRRIRYAYLRLNF